MFWFMDGPFQLTDEKQGRVLKENSCKFKIG